MKIKFQQIEQVQQAQSQEEAILVSLLFCNVWKQISHILPFHSGLEKESLSIQCILFVDSKYQRIPSPE